MNKYFKNIFTCAKRLRTGLPILNRQLKQTVMRFNFFKAKEQATRNHEGALSWKMDAKAELFAAVVTASLSDIFYEKANDRMQRIKELIAQNEPAFVA